MIVDGKRCARLYRNGGIDDAGHEIPLRKITIGDRKTINMIDDSRRLKRTEQVIPIKITDNRNGKVNIKTVE
jgi:hypothetical protein